MWIPLGLLTLLVFPPRLIRPLQPDPISTGPRPAQGSNVSRPELSLEGFFAVSPLILCNSPSTNEK